MQSIEAREKLSKFISRQKQNVDFNANFKQKLVFNNKFSQIIYKKNLYKFSQFSQLNRQQKQQLNQNLQLNKNYYQQKQKKFKNWNQNQNQKIFNFKNQQQLSKTVNQKFYQKNSFNIKFNYVLVVIILFCLLLQPISTQTWTVFNATTSQNLFKYSVISLSDDQKLAVTINDYQNLAIWSVNYPTLIKLQYFPKDNYAWSSYNQIFIWNNGQKIFVAARMGYLFVYERNSDGLSWTRFSILIAYNNVITSIFVNKAGTTIYITIDRTSSNLVVLNWNGSSWLISKQITLADISNVQITRLRNVYLTKDQSELWVHGCSNNTNYKVVCTICFFQIASNSFQMKNTLSTSSFIAQNGKYNQQLGMQVSPNQKFISWRTYGVNIIAVFDQSQQRYILIKKQPGIMSNAGRITYYSINKNNILNELFNSYYDVIYQWMCQFNRYQINYDGSSPSSTNFTVKSSNTLPTIQLAETCFSKSSNFVFFVKADYPFIIYSLGTNCSSLSNCLECIDSSKCNRCYPGYKLSSNQKCDSCQNGYYTVLNSSPLSCPSCPQRCATCQSSTNCTSCSKQYVLSNWNCLSCSSGYYMNNTYCLPCINNCESCTGSTVCSKCLAGYYLTTSSNKQVCIKCPTGCLLCSSSSTCSSCIQSFGYVLNSNQLCVQCSPNCVTCLSQASCRDCKSNFQKVNGQCVCTQGYYLDGSQCLACQTRCKSCVNGVLCTACKDPFSNLAFDCLSCGENFVLGISQTCQFCDPNGRIIVSLRTSTGLRKGCAFTKIIEQIPNCAQFELQNSIYQCKTCASGSTPKTNVLRHQQFKTECVLNNDIQKAKPQCTSFRVSQSNHFCSACAYPYSLRHVPNIQNKIYFQCVQILSLEYQKNCRTQTGQIKPSSQCNANQKRVAKINMDMNKSPVSSLIKLITPKFTMQVSSYCKNFVCSTETPNI